MDNDMHAAAQLLYCTDITHIILLPLMDNDMHSAAQLSGAVLHCTSLDGDRHTDDAELTITRINYVK